MVAAGRCRADQQLFDRTFVATAARTCVPWCSQAKAEHSAPVQHASPCPTSAESFRDFRPRFEGEQKTHYRGGQKPLHEPRHRFRTRLFDAAHADNCFHQWPVLWLGARGSPVMRHAFRHPRGNPVLPGDTSRHLPRGRWCPSNGEARQPSHRDGADCVGTSLQRRRGFHARGSIEGGASLRAYDGGV